MAELSPNGFWTGQILDPDVAAVTVNIMRAGTLPSQVCCAACGGLVEIPEQVALHPLCLLQ